MKKKTLQKMLSVLVCAGMAASLLTGCGGSDSEGKSEESGEGKFAGQTLTVSVEDGGEYALWYESIKDEFEKETGATVNLEGASNEAVLSEAMAKSGYYDVLTVDGPLIPQWASLGYLMPLDDYIACLILYTVRYCITGRIFWKRLVSIMRRRPWRNILKCPKR